MPEIWQNTPRMSAESAPTTKRAVAQAAVRAAAPRQPGRVGNA
ncbi:hypothetical protein AB0K02_21265 [Streptomyces sp. NPDC049597]